MSYPDVADTETAFYNAFRELDLEKMKAVWLDSTTSSCIHPGSGLLIGFEKVLASWAGIFSNSQVPKVEHRLVQASTDAHLAVHTVEENVTSGSGARSALILATNVYSRVDGRWYMIAHHASLPLVEPQQEKDPPPLH